MPVPKKKTSPSRRGNRRSHDALRVPAISNCLECGAPVAPHRACQECGKFKGEEVIKVEEA